MEKQLTEGAVGTVGKYNVAFVGGKLVLTVNAHVSPVEATLGISVDAGEVLEALKKAIPGKIDDMVIDMAKAELLK